MKKLSLPILITLLVFTVTSCKKEVSPEIEITVLTEAGQPRGGTTVKTSVQGASYGIINDQVIDQAQTDKFGKAYFKYDNTILIDIAIYKGNVIVDSASILAETKRLKRKEDNVYERTLIYR